MFHGLILFAALVVGLGSLFRPPLQHLSRRSRYPDKLIVNAHPPRLLKLRASALERLFVCAATVIGIIGSAMREALLTTRLSPQIDCHDDGVVRNAFVGFEFLALAISC